MTAGPWTTTNAFRTNLVTGAYGNLTASNAVNIALFQSSSTIGATSTTYTALATAGGEVASGGGYTTGGLVDVTLTDSGTTSVTLTPAANAVWTATGSGISGADFAVAYLASNSDIIAFATLNTSGAETVTAGNTLTIENTNPILTVA
jgi:hypothetical protein